MHRRRGNYDRGFGVPRGHRGVGKSRHRFPHGDADEVKLEGVEETAVAMTTTSGPERNPSEAAGAPPGSTNETLRKRRSLQRGRYDGQHATDMVDNGIKSEVRDRGVGAEGKSPKDKPRRKKTPKKSPSSKPSHEQFEKQKISSRRKCASKSPGDGQDNIASTSLGVSSRSTDKSKDFTKALPKDSSISSKSKSPTEDSKMTRKQTSRPTTPTFRTKSPQEQAKMKALQSWTGGHAAARIFSKSLNFSESQVNKKNPPSQEKFAKLKKNESSIVPSSAGPKLEKNDCKIVTAEKIGLNVQENDVPGSPVQSEAAPEVTTVAKAHQIPGFPSDQAGKLEILSLSKNVVVVCQASKGCLRSSQNANQEGSQLSSVNASINNVEKRITPKYNGGKRDGDSSTVQQVSKDIAKLDISAASQGGNPLLLKEAQSPDIIQTCSLEGHCSGQQMNRRVSPDVVQSAVKNMNNDSNSDKLLSASDCSDSVPALMQIAVVETGGRKDMLANLPDTSLEACYGRDKHDKDPVKTDKCDEALTGDHKDTGVDSSAGKNSGDKYTGGVNSVNKNYFDVNSVNKSARIHSSSKNVSVDSYASKYAGVKSTVKKNFNHASANKVSRINSTANNSNSSPTANSIRDDQRSFRSQRTWTNQNRTNQYKENCNSRNVRYGSGQFWHAKTPLDVVGGPEKASGQRPPKTSHFETRHGNTFSPRVRRDYSTYNNSFSGVLNKGVDHAQQPRTSVYGKFRPEGTRPDCGDRKEGEACKRHKNVCPVSYTTPEALKALNTSDWDIEQDDTDEKCDADRDFDEVDGAEFERRDLTPQPSDVVNCMEVYNVLHGAIEDSGCALKDMSPVTIPSEASPPLSHGVVNSVEGISAGALSNSVPVSHCSHEPVPFVVPIPQRDRSNESEEILTVDVTSASQNAGGQNNLVHSFVDLTREYDKVVGDFDKAFDSSWEALNQERSTQGVRNGMPGHPTIEPTTVERYSRAFNNALQNWQIDAASSSPRCSSPIASLDLTMENPTEPRSLNLHSASSAEARVCSSASPPQTALVGLQAHERQVNSNTDLIMDQSYTGERPLGGNNAHVSEEPTVPCSTDTSLNEGYRPRECEPLSRNRVEKPPKDDSDFSSGCGYYGNVPRLPISRLNFRRPQRGPTPRMVHPMQPGSRMGMNTGVPDDIQQCERNNFPPIPKTRHIVDNEFVADQNNNRPCGTKGAVAYFKEPALIRNNATLRQSPDVVPSRFVQRSSPVGHFQNLDNQVAMHKESGQSAKDEQSHDSSSSGDIEDLMNESNEMDISYGLDRFPSEFSAHVLFKQKVQKLYNSNNCITSTALSAPGSSTSSCTGNGSNSSNSQSSVSDTRSSTMSRIGSFSNTATTSGGELPSRRRNTLTGHYSSRQKEQAPHIPPQNYAPRKVQKAMQQEGTVGKFTGGWSETHQNRAVNSSSPRCPQDVPSRPASHGSCDYSAQTHQKSATRAPKAPQHAKDIRSPSQINTNFPPCWAQQSSSPAMVPRAVNMYNNKFVAAPKPNVMPSRPASAPSHPGWTAAPGSEAYSDFGHRAASVGSNICSKANTDMVVKPRPVLGQFNNNFHHKEPKERFGPPAYRHQGPNQHFQPPTTGSMGAVSNVQNYRSCTPPGEPVDVCVAQYSAPSPMPCRQVARNDPNHFAFPVPGSFERLSKNSVSSGSDMSESVGSSNSCRTRTEFHGPFASMPVEYSVKRTVVQRGSLLPYFKGPPPGTGPVYPKGPRENVARANWRSSQESELRRMMDPELYCVNFDSDFSYGGKHGVNVCEEAAKSSPDACSSTDYGRTKVQVNDAALSKASSSCVADQNMNFSSPACPTYFNECMREGDGMNTVSKRLKTEQEMDWFDMPSDGAASKLKEKSVVNDDYGQDRCQNAGQVKVGSMQNQATMERKAVQHQSASRWRRSSKTNSLPEEGKTGTGNRRIRLNREMAGMAPSRPETERDLKCMTSDPSAAAEGMGGSMEVLDGGGPTADSSCSVRVRTPLKGTSEPLASTPIINTSDSLECNQQQPVKYVIPARRSVGLDTSTYRASENESNLNLSVPLESSNLHQSGVSLQHEEDFTNEDVSSFVSPVSPEEVIDNLMPQFMRKNVTPWATMPHSSAVIGPQCTPEQVQTLLAGEDAKQNLLSPALDDSNSDMEPSVADMHSKSANQETAFLKYKDVQRRRRQLRMSNSTGSMLARCQDDAKKGVGWGRGRVLEHWVQNSQNASGSAINFDRNLSAPQQYGYDGDLGKTSKGPLKTEVSCDENLQRQNWNDSCCDVGSNTTSEMPSYVNFQYTPTTNSSSESQSLAMAAMNRRPGLESVTWDWKPQFRQAYFGFRTPYIDTHCHLDFLLNRSGFKGTYAEYRQENSDTYPPNYQSCVAIFCNPKTWRASYGVQFHKIVDEDGVFAAVGCHPKCATDFGREQEQILIEMLRHPKIRALGEIGLDYSNSFRESRDVQILVFRRQMEIAKSKNLPLVIHCRDAEQDCIELLQRVMPNNYKIHRHCFTGTWEEADHWLRLFPNSMIGLTPLVTHRRSYGPRCVAQNIPLNRLLLETDAPYFVPQKIPKRAMDFSHPGMALTVAAEVALLRNLDVESVLYQCLLNSKTFYNLP